MKWKTRLILTESAVTAATFTVAIYSYYFFAVWGPSEIMIPGLLRDYLTSPAVHLELLPTGILVGGMIGLINRLTESERLRHRALIQLILIRTMLYLITTVVVAVIIAAIFLAFVFDRETFAAMFHEMPTRYTISLAVWFVLVVAFINLTLEVARVLGHMNLWRLFIGRYRKPRNEERVFLFMDLKGSTTLTETLGNERYSQLLQECYRDLTSVVVQHGARVHEYVGDEVIVSWPSTGRSANLQTSVRTAIAYQNALAGKKDQYLRKYGVMPVFRSGIDVGGVTVIEVGDVKRQIVYNGDVLNTAARLVDLCKTRGDGLVVSDPIAAAVKEEEGVRVTWNDSVSLRGKLEPIGVWALEPVAAS